MTHFDLMLFYSLTQTEDLISHIQQEPNSIMVLLFICIYIESTYWTGSRNNSIISLYTRSNCYVLHVFQRAIPGKRELYRHANCISKQKKTALNFATTSFRLRFVFPTSSRQLSSAQTRAKMKCIFK